MSTLAAQKSLDTFRITDAAVRKKIFRAAQRSGLRESRIVLGHVDSIHSAKTLTDFKSILGDEAGGYFHGHYLEQMPRLLQLLSPFRPKGERPA